jgi:hypothetical protein
VPRATPQSAKATTPAVSPRSKPTATPIGFAGRGFGLKYSSINKSNQRQLFNTQNNICNCMVASDLTETQFVDRAVVFHQSQHGLSE